MWQSIRMASYSWCGSRPDRFGAVARRVHAVAGLGEDRDRDHLVDQVVLGHEQSSGGRFGACCVDAPRSRRSGRLLLQGERPPQAGPEILPVDRLGEGRAGFQLREVSGAYPPPSSGPHRWSTVESAWMAVVRFTPSSWSIDWSTRATATGARSSAAVRSSVPGQRSRRRRCRRSSPSG